MSALIKMPDTRLPAIPQSDPWLMASDAQRQTAQWRHELIAPAAALVEQGASVNHAAALLARRIELGVLDMRQRSLIARLKETLSVPTIKRWLSAYKKEGKAGLLPKHSGRVRKDYGWEATAVELYNLPSKPSYAAVALRLRKDGFESATDSRVKRYLQSMPATLGQQSPHRIGRHLHKLQHRKWQPRDRNSVMAGEVYAGDGHTIDCYVAHPNTGKLYRPELTAFIDIQSAYITGWYLSDAESSISTLFALSSAMLQHDHVPAALYIDRGSGYRSKMLNDDTTGFYQRFDISVIAALPGNPHGKGWIERWFRTLRDHHDKFFAGGMFYCGNDMAPEINRRLSTDVDSGKRKLPSLMQYVDSFARFIDEYNNTPKPSLDGRTPAQIWAGLDRVPVELTSEATIRPREIRTVQKRHIIELHKRTYWHQALGLYEQGTRLIVEYDLHNDSHVWLFEESGRFVCQADLQQTIGIIPQSRLDEQRQKRLAGQQKRLERKLDEAYARAQDSITVTHQLEQLETIEPQRLAKPKDSGIVINLLGDD